MKVAFLKSVAKAGGLVRKGRLLKATDVLQNALIKLRPAILPAPPKVLRAKKRRPAAPRVMRGPDRFGSVRDTGAAMHARWMTMPSGRAAVPAGSGRFLAAEFDADGQQGRYKVFVPNALGPDLVPLVVMLHGCTQTPDDFAAGTEMNARAVEQGFVVLYPEQSRTANPSACWNWYRQGDQARGSGEPELIAAMTRAVIAQFNVDPRRVFIAGLSAGGAMAAIVAREYPELFGAVGIHSGLGAGAAKNLPDALSVMRTGQARTLPLVARGLASPPAAPPFIPTIVFHGDADTTVHPDNGRRAIEAAIRGSRRQILQPSRFDGATVAGVKFSSFRYGPKAGAPLAEHWIVAGGAHAWSGGNGRGRYTDPRGPSATDEMLRFFAQQSRAPSR